MTCLDLVVLCEGLDLIEEQLDLNKEHVEVGKVVVDGYVDFGTLSKLQGLCRPQAQCSLHLPRDRHTPLYVHIV
jgi:hypothetical protein